MKSGVSAVIIADEIIENNRIGFGPIRCTRIELGNSLRMLPQ